MTKPEPPLALSTLPSKTATVSLLLEQASEVGLITNTELADWNNRGLTTKEKLKRLLDRMSSLRIRLATPTTLHDLWGLIDESETTRAKLVEPATWRQVFLHACLPLTAPIQATPITDTGRCNYLFRIQGAKESYVVRYHDPLGRDFLQRYEPQRAVNIYCAVEQLLRTVLDNDSVANTLFPPPGLQLAIGKIPDTVELICRRILIQPDYRPGNFLLSEYRRVEPPLSREDLLTLALGNLARLHSRSRRLFQRSQQPSRSDPLARQFNKHREDVRFPNSNRYLGWLLGPNWISRRILASFSGGQAPPPLWQDLCGEIGLEPTEFLASCRELWRESAAEMHDHGSLAHLDWTPRNCFVDRDTRTNVRVFDFDYIAIVDPAYDLAITINSCLRVFLEEDQPTHEEEPIAFLKQALQAYDEYFAQSPPPQFAVAHDGLTGGEVEGVIRRASAFAGLAASATLADDLSPHSNRNPLYHKGSNYGYRFSAAAYLLRTGLKRIP